MSRPPLSSVKVIYTYTCCPHLRHCIAFVDLDHITHSVVQASVTNSYMIGVTNYV